MSGEARSSDQRRRPATRAGASLALILALLAVLALPAGGLASVGPAERANVSASPPARAVQVTTDPALASRLAAAVDQLRASSHRPALVVDPERTGLAASYRATDIATTRKVSSTTSDDLTISDLLLDQGVRFATAHEALAITTAGPSGVDPLPALLVTLLSDPTDRRLLLQGDANLLGVGVARRPGVAGAVTGTSDTRASAGMLVASVIVIQRDGPPAPDLGARSDGRGGAVVTLKPDGGGTMTVVVTDRTGTLLRILAWIEPVRGPVTLRWDGRLSNGRPAAAAIYQVRAFTVDTRGRASDPAVAVVTTHR